MKYLAPLFLILTGCASTQKSCAPCPTCNVLPSLKQEAPPAGKQTPIGKEKSEELLKHLKNIGVKPYKEKGTTYYTAFDLACQLQASDSGMSTECEYYDAPVGAKNRRRYGVKGKESYEDLRSFLFQYPVDQGDPGAKTTFAQCRTYEHGTDCHLAVNLNYEGP